MMAPYGAGNRPDPSGNCPGGSGWQRLLGKTLQLTKTKIIGCLNIAIIDLRTHDHE